MKKPDWRSHLKNNISRIFELSEKDRPSADKKFFLLIQKAQKEYFHWDKFRYQKMPNNISVEEAWCLLMMKRKHIQEVLPVKANNGDSFFLGLTKEQYKNISKIDSLTSGVISSNILLPEKKERNRLIVGAFIEEAIHSSQLEGASTLRETAEEMIRRQKTPRDEGEQMILNNYHAFIQIEQWLDRELSEDFIKEIHKVIVDNILPEDECGEYRKDEHKIVISNPVTDKVFHRPKKKSEMVKDMKLLFDFANDDNTDDYIHPVIRGIILHFWIGYLHPFTDGNGRLARLLFYWYMMKQGYRVFQYISISNVIKDSKTNYRDAYLNSEQEDELDVGYFVQYMLKVILLSIEKFERYLSKKKEGEDITRRILEKKGEFNDRQINIVYFLAKKQRRIMDIESHKQKFGLSYEMARRDFIPLEKKKF